MSEQISSFIWNSNTFSLYSNCWNNKPLDQVKEINPQYSSIINSLTKEQINQYNYWLSLTTEQKDNLIDEYF